eukprot:1423-Heterococcus_DN1.PRE.2
MQENASYTSSACTENSSRVVYCDTECIGLLWKQYGLYIGKRFWNSFALLHHAAFCNNCSFIGL